MDPLTLLNSSDPHPVRKYRENSAGSAFLLVGDHAGRAIPTALDRLGLSKNDRTRHIAVDIGIAQLGTAVADLLDAPFISQRYSRLVVDCNRWPQDSEWIAESSDGTPVPGNMDLEAHSVAARKREIFDPYHNTIASVLDERASNDLQTIFVSLHSFTPVLNGWERPWEIGVLHNGHRDAFALQLLKRLQGSKRNIGDNEPYEMDATDFTVPFHAFARDLAYVEIEIRQDLLAGGVKDIARLLATKLGEALRTSSETEYRTLPQR